MPDVPDFIRKRMEERLDYGTEEFVGRRVLRAAGIVGKEAVKELRSNFFTDEDSDPTLFSMASFLLEKALPVMQLKVRAAALKRYKDLHDEFRVHPLRREGLMMLARVGDGSAFALFSIEKMALLTMMRPPYRVFDEDEEDQVLIEQELETFCRSLSIGDVAQDILHGRLRV